MGVGSTLNLDTPRWWATRHGPLVRVWVVGTSRHQETLAELRRRTQHVPIAAYPEPDNVHDPQAVAIVVAGRVLGHLQRDYAALWQPVILTEHAAGRAVTGWAQIADGPRGLLLRAELIQPAPVGPWAPPSGPPLPYGIAAFPKFWPEHRAAAPGRAGWWRRRAVESLVRRQRRAARRAASSLSRNPALRYQSAVAQARLSGRRPGEVAMTRIEWRLYRYIAQCPEPFLFYPQVPFGHRLTLDFFCPNAMLCVEVDGAEHRRGEHVLSDERRDAYLKSCGVATFRITNSEVNTDPRRAAEKVFKRVCKRQKIYVHTNPASPFHSWAPRDPLMP